MKIGNCDHFETFAFQIDDHLLERWEALAINGERTVILLVIDIQIDHVSGNLALAEFARDLPHPRFGIVAVAALLISEGKQRRQRRAPDQLREILNHALGIGPVKEVIVQFPAVGSE